MAFNYYWRRIVFYNVIPFRLNAYLDDIHLTSLKAKQHLVNLKEEVTDEA